MVVALDATAVPARAQNPTLIHPKRAEFSYDDRLNPDLVRKAVLDFATCALERRRNSSMEYLAALPESRESRRYLSRLVDEDCLGTGRMKFSEPLFRGAMYQRLYLDTYRNDPVPDLSALASPDYFQDVSPLNAAEQQGVAIRQFADCVVRDQPEVAHRLATSLIGSSEENGSFSTLMPSFSKCLAKNKTLEFKKSQLRGTMAEVLYRIRTESKPAGTEE
ncbi:hypothetical protein B2G71_08105 [Novosphingobium sp. PC22D]|nr:hypothetical protein B2G71_08105 [Novosphingobium sp. PC22D]